MVLPYIHACMRKNLVEFNLVIERHTAKPPNLIPRQIFRLYSIMLNKHRLTTGRKYVLIKKNDYA